MKPASSNNEHADASAMLAPALPADDLDEMLSGLTQDGRRAVRDMLDLIAHRLAGQSATAHGMRRRLDAVIAGLSAVADAIDGDCDLEGGADAEPITAAENAGRGFHLTPTAGHDDDEDDDREHQLTDDNGFADFDGEAEQLGRQHRQGGWVIG